MAKDYFQDILPPEGGAAPRRAVPPPRMHDEEPHQNPPMDDMAQESSFATQSPESEKSIRNISMPNRSRPRPVMEDFHDVAATSESSGMKDMLKRWWIWAIAAVSVAVLGLLLLVSLRSTTVTVTPRSHAVTFDQSSQFTAYPEESVATGTLGYTVQTSDLEDSEVVPSQGTVHAEDKATGSITVYNNYQTSSYKLIKNTRFESADGKIFRTPAEVVIPGKKGTTPGQVTVTVVADQAGDTYNVAAGKFSVPGLKSLSAQYADIYAKSSAPMTGGFVGDKPGVAPGAKEAALSAVRARLETKARSTYTQSDGTVIFPDLIKITYEDKPDTTEAGGGIRIHEVAHVTVPVFKSSAFASAVYADANGAAVTIRLENGLVARQVQDNQDIGSSPIQFSLAGKATIIWNVDSSALAAALAGKKQDAFQAIATQFPGVLEASARVEPFWSSTFPADAKAIKIDIQPIKS